MEEKCSECRFYFTGLSVCRRYPPTLVLETMRNAYGTEWQETRAYETPVVGDGWCGEFKRVPATGEFSLHGRDKFYEDLPVAVCELCDTEEECRTGKTPCYLSGEFMVAPGTASSSPARYEKPQRQCAQCTMPRLCDSRSRKCVTTGQYLPDLPKNGARYPGTKKLNISCATCNEYSDGSCSRYLTPVELSDCCLDWKEAMPDAPSFQES